MREERKKSTDWIAVGMRTERRVLRLAVLLLAILRVFRRNGGFQCALQNREEIVEERERLGRERFEAFLTVRVDRFARKRRRRGARHVRTLEFLALELLHDGFEEIGGGHPGHISGARDETSGREIGRRSGEHALRGREERKTDVHELDAMRQRLVER